MSVNSKISYETSDSYLWMPKFYCDCCQFGDLWRSNTRENPGRLFVQCGLDKACGFWEWEDVLTSGKFKKYKQGAKGKAARGMLEKQLKAPAARLVDISNELFIMRCALMLIAVAVVWIAKQA